MTYYLKYRPQTLEELDQTGVRESLKKLVKSGNIPHAILFSGPKGTGKTSAARILAKIVNCESPKGIEPCNKCEQCKMVEKGGNLDVIELDAASHRGIEDIRQIRDAVKLSPVAAKKKVYIIDEAHMLTPEASNALLKTLEEPPEHVLFILATTNPEKLIDTIRSRVTNIVFKKATIEEVVGTLKKIAKGENLKVGEEVFEVIANTSGGSFRDAVKLFEQLVNENVELVKEKVEEILTSRKSFDVNEFLKLLSKKDTQGGINLIDSAIQKGAPAKDIAGLIIDRLRELLLVSVGMEGEQSRDFGKEELINLTNLFSDAYVKVSSSFIEQLPLEIAVIEWCEKQVDASSENKIVSRKTEAKTAHTSEDGDISFTKVDATFSSGSLLNDNMSEEIWSKVLSAIRPGHASTEALLRAAKPLEFNGSTLKLGVYYKFHKEHLEGAPHRDILEKALASFLGGSIRVICTLTEPPADKIKSVKVDGDGSQNGADHVVLTEPKDELSVDSLTTEGGEDIIKIAEKIFNN